MGRVPRQPGNLVDAELRSSSPSQLHSRKDSMKQGKASRDVEEGFKREPNPRIVNPGAVNQLGNHVGNRGAIESFYGGMGYKTSAVPTLGKGNQGPGAHRDVHRTGSQGRR